MFQGISVFECIAFYMRDIMQKCNKLRTLLRIVSPFMMISENLLNLVTISHLNTTTLFKDDFIGFNI